LWHTNWKCRGHGKSRQLENNAWKVDNVSTGAKEEQRAKLFLLLSCFSKEPVNFRANEIYNLGASRIDSTQTSLGFQKMRHYCNKIQVTSATLCDLISQDLEKLDCKSSYWYFFLAFPLNWTKISSDLDKLWIIIVINNFCQR